MTPSPIQIVCTGCPKRLRVAATAAGKKVRCPACQTVLTVPLPLDDEDIPVAEYAEVAPAAPRPAAPAAAADPFDFFAGEPAPVTGPTDPLPDREYFYVIEPSALTSNRLYRMYADGDRLVGLFVGKTTELTDAIGRAVRANLGAVGTLIGTVLRDRAEAGYERRQAAMEGRTLNESLAADPNSFEIDAEDVTAADVSVPSFWFTSKYTDVPRHGLLNVTLADATQRQFAFVDVPDIRIALARLPAVLGDTLAVKVRWDSRSKTFAHRP